MSTFGNAPAVKQPPSMNSGDSDASPNGTPSQFLLLRGLEPTVSEDLLAKGVSKLYKPSRRSTPPTASSSKKGISKVASTTGDANLGAKEGSLRRVLLVRDRRSNESWRYGFAEFATVEVGISTTQLIFAHRSRRHKPPSFALTLLINLQSPPSPSPSTTSMPAYSYPCSQPRIQMNSASILWVTPRPSLPIGTKKPMLVNWQYLLGLQTCPLGLRMAR